MVALGCGCLFSSTLPGGTCCDRIWAATRCAAMKSRSIAPASAPRRAHCSSVRFTTIVTFPPTTSTVNAITGQCPWSPNRRWSQADAPAASRHSPSSSSGSTGSTYRGSGRNTSHCAISTVTSTPYSSRSR